LALEKIDALFKTTPLPSSITPQSQPGEEEKPLPQLKIKPRKLTIPPTESVALKVGLKPPPTKKKKKKKKSQPLPATFSPVKIPPYKTQKPSVTVEAKTSPDLPIPVAPDQPNIIVGMILDRQGKIIENAIIEIREVVGDERNVVRATISNRLGQFQIANPLGNGTYEIEVEKEDFEFDIIKITLTGEIVPPIEIRAK